MLVRLHERRGEHTAEILRGMLVFGDVAKEGDGLATSFESYAMSNVNSYGWSNKGVSASNLRTTPSTRRNEQLANLIPCLTRLSSFEHSTRSWSFQGKYCLAFGTWYSVSSY